MNLFPWRKRIITSAPDPEPMFTATEAYALVQKALAANSDDALARMIVGANPQAASDVDQSNYLQSYEKNIWVNACVVARADACASVPIKLRNRKSGEDIDSHELLDLLQYVNDGENWPWFVGGLSSYRDLAGEAFIALGPNPQRPQAMYLLLPPRMKPKVTAGRIVGWLHTVAGAETFIPAEAIIQCKRFSPMGGLRGQPVIQAGEPSINLDIAVRRYNNSYLRRGATPPFILTPNTPGLDKDQAKEIQKAWTEEHAGPDKAGIPAVLPHSMTATILSDGKKEGSFTDLARLSKGEILAMFKTPPIVVQDYSDASVLANADVQERRFWRATILDGEMTQILGTLNESLVPRFGKDLELYADEENMPQLQESEDVRDARITQSVGGPWRRVNEGRVKAGLEPVEGGDVILVNPMLIPLGMEPPPPSAPAAPVPLPVSAEPTPPKALPPPKVASVLTLRHKSLVGEYGSDAHKAHFKAFTDRLEPQVVRMRRTVGDINEDLLAEVIANLEAEGGKGHRVTVPDLRLKAVADQYLFDLDAAGKVYVKQLMPLESASIEDGAARAIAELGGGAFDLTDPRVVEWLATKKLKITTLPKTLYDSIHLHLSQGVEQGRTIQQIAGDLRDLQPMYQRSFAERIARTEVVGANNAGSLEAYRQNDVKQKEWSSALDGEVRCPDNGSKFDHRDMHVSIVAVEKPFNVSGEQLMHPGDQGGGSAGNVCNCRCAVLPVVD